MDGELAPRMAVPEDVQSYLTQAFLRASQWNLPGRRGSSETATAVEIRKVAVIGGDQRPHPESSDGERISKTTELAGTMGRGIAIALFRAGYTTILVENDEKALKFCKEQLELTYAREVQLKRWKAAEVDGLRSKMTMTTNLRLLADVDLVIEAVFETLRLKKELFAKLDEICKSTCIFGTNTSSLDLDEMSSTIRDRSRLVGIHFFNPAHVIKVVEIVFGSHTSATAVATAFSACSAMKKVAVLVGNCPAFMFNRLLSVYLSQAHKLAYAYGFSPRHIDQIVTSAGFLMGPLTMHDMNGLDVAEKLKAEHNWELNPIEKELLARKRYGRKTAKGFYKYDEQQKKHDDDEVEQIIARLAASASPQIRILSDEDALEFLLFPMVNEGFLCIEEGIIQDEKLIDIMFTFGFGWPTQHGGPMRYGRSVGIGKVAEAMAHWNAMALLLHIWPTRDVGEVAKNPKDRSFQISKTLTEAKSKI